MKCPCINCICVPICRQKLYGYLFMDCALIRKYMPTYDVIHLRDVGKMKTIIEILHPPHWKYEIDTALNTKFPIVQFTGDPQAIKVQIRKGDKP